TNSNEPIYVGNQDVTVDNNNNLLLDSQIAYKFNIVDFENYDNLNKAGDNLYYSENARATNNYNLKQGVKEGSNVDLIDATSELMANLRAFEANQKVVQIMDSALSKIANEIGAVR
ncbi:MAG: flagellar basal body rod C-terminal domain-containing protein, partial [Peptostreptococcaceae bacterium]